MDKRIKDGLFDYYIAKDCVCGKEKNDHSWLCRTCTIAMLDEELRQTLFNTCDAHMETVLAYISKKHKESELGGALAVLAYVSKKYKERELAAMGMQNRRQANTLLALAKDHKENCDSDCGISLHSLYPLFERLKGSAPTDAERAVFW
jgi:hypothetical protein